MISLEILAPGSSRTDDLEARLPHAARAVERHFRTQLPDTRIVVANPRDLAEQTLNAWTPFVPDATNTARRNLMRDTTRNFRWLNGQTYIAPGGIQIAIVAGRRGDLGVLLTHELIHAHQLNNSTTRAQEITIIRRYLETYEMTRDEDRALRQTARSREREARQLDKRLARAADKAAR